MMSSWWCQHISWIAVARIQINKWLEFIELTSYLYKRTETLRQVSESQPIQWTDIHRTKLPGHWWARGLLSDSDTTGDHRSSQDSHLRHWTPRTNNHRIEPRPSCFINRLWVYGEYDRRWFTTLLVRIEACIINYKCCWWLFASMVLKIISTYYVV